MHRHEYSRWQSPPDQMGTAFLSLTASRLAALARDRQSLTLLAVTGHVSFQREWHLET